jgi:hypothetical protein
VVGVQLRSTPPGHPALTPLRPQEFFARRWQGEGRFIPRPWLRRFIHPRRLRFRSSTTWLSDELWFVHDDTVWEDGRVERRDGLAQLVAPDRIRLTYDDLLGGSEVRLHPNHYTLSPYLMAVSVAPLPVPLLVRCVDRCELASDGSLLDTIDMAIAGVALGRQVMRLLPDDGS